MNKIHRLFLFIPLMFMISCSEKNNSKDSELNGLAEQYVQLGLNIGQYDPDFVDNVLQLVTKGITTGWNKI